MIFLKKIINLIISIFLIVCGTFILLFPTFKFIKVKYIFIIILSIYSILNIIKYIISKNKSSIFISLSTILILIIAFNLDINKVPWYLALVLLIWIILLSVIKLTSSDKNNNNIWMINIISLIIFILSGLLTVMNLYYESDIQIIILGYFLLIYGILELFEYFCLYLINRK